MRNIRRRVPIAVLLLSLFAMYACKVRISDPTEGNHAVSILNDTPNTIYIALCVDTRCTTLAPGGKVLQPGESLLQNMQTDSQLQFSVKVKDSPSAVQRCKELTVGHVVAKQYLVSSLGRCG
jgi:hypothetical protein